VKIYTEFVVLHDDVPMPDEEAFCPSFWQADDFDSDGDFYATGLGGRWSDLTLRKRVPDGPDSVLTVQVLREARDYPPGLRESHELERFFDHRRAGRYDHLPFVKPGADLAVTALATETGNLPDYREFLQTVNMFLSHTHGHVISPWERDQHSFTTEFLD